MTSREALERLAARYGLRYDVPDSGTLIVSRRQGGKERASADLP